MEPRKKGPADLFVLFIAQGFGSGRFPFAPGTFGSVIGLVWIYLLLRMGSIWLYLGAVVGGFFLAIWIGHRAELILGVEDPGSIVIDEIAALPVTYLPAVLLDVASSDWIPFAITFFTFRVFDIAKPLGIARVQKLPRGWGLVLDDFLAALAAAPFVFLYCVLLA